MPGRLLHSSAVCALALCAAVAACRPQSEPPSSASSKTAHHPQLAQARVDLAKAALARNAPDEALAYLVSALEANPDSTDARSLAGEILAQTRWSFPQITIAHGQEIDHLTFSPPSTLWVSLSGPANTAVRWNLESLQLESVLFPFDAPATRSLIPGPGGKSVVIERAGVTLLCAAPSLTPIREIGLLPDFVTPTSVVAFSPNGLLIAHPEETSDTENLLVWRIRDAATGEIVRSSEPIAPDEPRPLAACLDRQLLRVLRTDGSVLEMPVSPVESVRITPAAEPVSLLHAVFSEDGNSALALKDVGNHRPPDLIQMPLKPEAAPAFEPDHLLEHFPWSLQPNFWNGLMRQVATTPIRVDGDTLFLHTAPHAPIHTESAITATAFSGNQGFIGERNGTLTIHQWLPMAALSNRQALPLPTIQARDLASFATLTQSLAGCRFDETSNLISRLDSKTRLAAIQHCDPESLRRIFPNLDFSRVIEALKAIQLRVVGPADLKPLHDRLARANPNTAPPLPELHQAFNNAETDAVLAAIQDSGSKGPAAAKALELALASTHPEWIEACLAQAEDLPPLLHRLARSRIAWLQDRKADAISGWPDHFPDLPRVRLCEDWDGWEQADYTIAFEKFRLCVREELDALEVLENSTPEQRKAVADRLKDPATMKAVGRERLAAACLNAALAMSPFKDDAETTFQLANLARQFGAAPEPCFRAEALALTALGDYQKAHSRWISLITDFPVHTHEPGDYAEAAYTAFENADPRQAMAILTTGLHRFPRDANFALRAGWVALLTGNSERAYRFLLTGRQIGYPPDKLENATALLAIAAEQSGAAEDAAAFYHDLVELSSDWKKTATIDSLEWPEEMKTSLRQLVP